MRSLYANLLGRRSCGSTTYLEFGVRWRTEAWRTDRPLAAALTVLLVALAVFIR